MGIHFAISPRERLVRYAVEGSVGPGDARAFFDAVLAHPDYRCGFDFFGDRRTVDAAPEPSYVYTIAAEVFVRARILAPCRWAVVVADDTAFFRARTWAVLAAASGVEIRPFRTAEEANDWLGLFGGPVPPANLITVPTPPPQDSPSVGAESTRQGDNLTAAEDHFPILSDTPGGS